MTAWAALQRGRFVDNRSAAMLHVIETRIAPSLDYKYLNEKLLGEATSDEFVEKLRSARQSLAEPTSADADFTIPDPSRDPPIYHN